jgi:hypothetical protein
VTALDSTQKLDQTMLNTSSNIGRDKSFVYDLNKERCTSPAAVPNHYWSAAGYSMPIGSEQFELPYIYSHTTTMDHETRYDPPSIRNYTGEQEDERALSEGENNDSTEMSRQRKDLFHLSLSFFLFGLINNVLYVIILSAALDLVPPSTPKGIITFWNIAPCIVAKFSWPYILKGQIRYVRRIIGCCFLSVTGMIVVATSEGLSSRLFGIGCASFAAGEHTLTISVHLS